MRKRATRGRSAWSTARSEASLDGTAQGGDRSLGVAQLQLRAPGRPHSSTARLDAGRSGSRRRRSATASASTGSRCTRMSMAATA